MHVYPVTRASAHKWHAPCRWARVVSINEWGSFFLDWQVGSCPVGKIFFCVYITAFVSVSSSVIICARIKHISFHL